MVNLDAAAIRLSGHGGARMSPYQPLVTLVALSRLGTDLSAPAN
jgi:hypothetical protein